MVICYNFKLLCDIIKSSFEISNRKISSLRKEGGMKETIWDVPKLMGMSTMYWKISTLFAGTSLDVFSIIGENGKTAKDVAVVISGDERATAMVLDAIAAMELLEKKDNTYHNTPFSSKFLCKSSPAYIGFIIGHHYQLAKSWASIPEAVKTGKPVRKRISSQDENDPAVIERRENFLMGMFNLAMTVAPKLVPVVDLAGKKTFLDFGGGPGTYAIHFCKAYPDLTATVFDLPTTRPFAEKTIASFGMEKRIQFQPGSFFTDDICAEPSYDVAFLSHVLHGECPENAALVVDKAAKTLLPGGILVIHEFVLNNDRSAPLFPALFSINMLLGTEGGQSYSEKELKEIMAKAGLKDIKRVDFDSPNDSAMLVGYKL